jgi:hypothetical protein
LLYKTNFSPLSCTLKLPETFESHVSIIDYLSTAYNSRQYNRRNIVTYILQQYKQCVKPDSKAIQRNRLQKQKNTKNKKYQQSAAVKYGSLFYVKTQIIPRNMRNVVRKYLRKCWVYTDVDWLCQRSNLQGLSGIGMICSERQVIRTGVSETAVHYFILSKPDIDAAQLLNIKRSHWPLRTGCFGFLI